MRKIKNILLALDIICIVVVIIAGAGYLLGYRTVYHEEKTYIINTKSDFNDLTSGEDIIFRNNDKYYITTSDLFVKEDSLLNGDDVRAGDVTLNEKTFYGTAAREIDCAINITMIIVSLPCMIIILSILIFILRKRCSNMIEL